MGRPKNEVPRLRNGSLEETVLRSVMHIRGDAYGVNIHEKVLEAEGRDLTLGAIYTTLDRLEAKGFLESWWGEPTEERGGRRKQYFRITGAGERALNEAEIARERMRLAFSTINLSLHGGEAL
jgi:DNA-binding PadR family transcriptional regulator